MELPKRINFERLREATAAPVPAETPTRVIQASELVRVGGLYRIRDNYETVWRMESNEDGKRYIIRADAEGDTAPERIRVESNDHAEDQPKAAQSVDAYKVIHAGAVYVAWECDACATPNLTKFGTRTYECDECHKRYADGDVLKMEQPKKSVYTKAEVEEYEPGFAKRMAALGISSIHESLLNVWEKEATREYGKPDDGRKVKCSNCSEGDHEGCKSKNCTCCGKLHEGTKAVNPWAVCHKSVGPEKSEKFERCVKDVKKKQPVKKD